MSKCKFLHFGIDMPQITLTKSVIGLLNKLQKKDLGITKEKDLGKIINNQMKFHQHVSFAASKAMDLIRVIWKIFCSIPIDTFL